MKKVIIGMILMIFTISFMTGCGCAKKQTKEVVKTNTNENVIKDQVLEVFAFTNTSLIYGEGKSTLETIVTNISEEVAYLSEFKIHIKDENDNEIIELIGFVGEKLQPKESRLITSYSIEDLTTATSISYEIIR